MILLVGDVQGCDEALSRLLAEAGASPSRDHLVLLGDLVNRGPDSLAVLRRAMAWGDAATVLLGNHDLHLLATAEGVRTPRRDDTLAALLAAPERDACLDFLRRGRLAADVAGWLCVHAGLPPSWDTRQALARAAEVEALLRGPGWPGFARQMYGNEPARWDDALTGDARARFVVNALTRIRFCRADGTLDFDTKEGAAAAPPGYFPWFEVPGRASAGQPIAFGHWSTLGLVDRPDLLALDTGCVWGGCLSGARVDGGRRELIQVRCPQQQRPAGSTTA